NVIFIFDCLVIFCCDGKDKSVEPVIVLDVAACVVDIVLDCKDIAAICLCWINRFETCRVLHLIIKRVLF
ncbi:unnamed protein product, partial [Rotaria sp. Silwood2]